MPERHAGIASSRGGTTIAVNVVHEGQAVVIPARRRNAGDIVVVVVVVVTENGPVPGEEEEEEEEEKKKKGDCWDACLHVDREISRVSERDTRQEQQEIGEEKENQVDRRERIVDCARRTERPRGFSSYGRG
ncbi:uncharacterized protein LOC116849144 [Odontomachus brunneus]|uniref:uncharacterized protein LOC116849144 n=1 Tax=Odontomachus brunneus TaxID=486640 RepID=UPI0013F1A21A|nr:uncharacterized protein LOC116849144 [Odontomachus brunneus]XP_032681910.1 uncharacterized protein LOC116849144 [Odontomachus brunneus]XP_032681911.1 uncharacterized protein LOC116849144 [Odontomachus brunneus]XP_032681912.1 uncharacterized protein LOC116849144 [Odontomachus brunneus]